MWHVLYVAPRSEKSVCRCLALRGLTSYVPEFRASARTRPGSVRGSRDRVIFPGYVFFQVPDRFSDWEHVRWAPGVRRVLHQDGAPAVVDDAVIEHVRVRASSRPPHSGARFIAGERVVVREGPLALVDAVFDRCLTRTDRVSILVHLLGRPITVEVDPGILRRAV